MYDRRQQRFEDRMNRRQMRFQNRMYRRANGNPLNAICGAIVLLALALAFAVSHATAGIFFLPILFFGLAICTLFRGLFGGSQRVAYGAFYGFFWLIILALFFMTSWWEWFLVGAALSIILSALARPIMGTLVGMGFSNTFANNQPQPTPPYQSPEATPYQPGQYQEGYQPPQQAGSYQEGDSFHTPQESQPHEQRPYEQPTTEYPQELPPQQ
jgi:hypothetical protein